MALRKLLIIDDDRETRNALQEIFISRRWEVAMAATQEEGLSLLAGYEPDWVIVSWDQLGGTGKSFVHEVRAGGRSTLVALLRERAGSSGNALIDRLRPDAVHEKPVSPEAVFRSCESRCVAPAAVG